MESFTFIYFYFGNKQDISFKPKNKLGKAKNSPLNLCPRSVHSPSEATNISSAVVVAFDGQGWFCLHFHFVAACLCCVVPAAHVLRRALLVVRSRCWMAYRKLVAPPPAGWRISTQTLEGVGHGLRNKGDLVLFLIWNTLIDWHRIHKHGCTKSNSLN